MFGLITRLTAHPGQRETLATLLLERMARQKDCLNYVVALDVANGDDLWLAEVWVDEAAHRDSIAYQKDGPPTGPPMWPLISKIHEPVITRPLPATPAASS